MSVYPSPSLHTGDSESDMRGKITKISSCPQNLTIYFRFFHVVCRCIRAHAEEPEFSATLSNATRSLAFFPESGNVADVETSDNFGRNAADQAVAGK